VKLLILGGTVFLGRHLVEAALARAHEITIFNRGLNNPDLFPEVERLRGDRDGDLRALEGRRWDAVIDTCGYLPRHVRASAQLLAGAVDHYTFTSTIGVYADFGAVGIDETAPVATVADENLEELTAESYGPLKALCEKTVEEFMPGRTLVIRAGLLVGPYDPLDRFTYWVRRVAQGGEVLAPGRPERQVQIIDARDLSEWIVRMVEAGQTGMYNASGPDHLLTMGRLLDESIAVSGSDARTVWVDDKFLVDHKAGAWQEVPLWLPENDRKVSGLMRIDCGRAIAAGLSFRPLADTIRDTLEWDRSRVEPPAPYKLFGIELARAGLSHERELALFEAWKGR
jgi:2'-hydroxyisoflavone reductase